MGKSASAPEVVAALSAHDAAVLSRDGVERVPPAVLVGGGVLKQQTDGGRVVLDLRVRCVRGRERVRERERVCVCVPVCA